MADIPKLALKLFLSILFALLISITLSAECEIDSIIVELSDCTDDGKVEVWIHFNHNQDSLGEFKVAGNGTEYGTYKYKDLPVNIGTIEVNPDLIYEFVAIDLSTENCSSAIDFGKIRCTTGDCSIQEVVITPIDTCIEEGQYEARLSVIAAGTDAVDVWINEEYSGFYPLSQLPSNILVSRRDSDYDIIKVAGNDNPDCRKIVEVLPPKCGSAHECGISHLDIIPVECDEATFYLKVKIDHFGPHGKSFSLRGNGEEYGVFKYQELPVFLGPFTAGLRDSLEFIATDLMYEECMVEAVISGSPCRESCFTSDLLHEILRCDSNTFDIKLYTSTDLYPSDSFKLKGNGQHYGKYAYEDLPLTLEKLDASAYDHYEFVIIDVVNHDCYIDLEVPDLICRQDHCPFDTVAFEVTECDTSNQFHVWVDFFVQEGRDGIFITKIGARSSEHLYSDLPVKVGPFPGGEEFYWLKLYDSEKEDCYTEFPIGRIVCPAQCDINAKIEFVQCMDGELLLRIDSVTSEFPAFDVYYGDMPIGFFKKDKFPIEVSVPYLEKDSIIVRLCVSDNTSCCFEKTLQMPACDQVCAISNLRSDTLECKNDSLWINLDFDHEIDAHQSFILKLGGEKFSEFLLSDLPLHIGPLKGGEDTRLHFVVKSSLMPDCSLELDLESPSCPEVVSENNEKLLVLEATERMFFVKVPDFIADPTDFRLVDIYGRIVHEVKFSSQSERAFVKIPHLSNGVFGLNMRSHKGEQFSTKIIVP